MHKEKNIINYIQATQFGPLSLQIVIVSDVNKYSALLWVAKCVIKVV